MYPHPDQTLFIALSRLNDYDYDAALHRRAAEAAIEAERRAIWEKRLFRLRYAIRNLLYRLAPGFARRFVL